SGKGKRGDLGGASGGAALIKKKLMLQHKTIPVQANFTTLHTKLSSIGPDRLCFFFSSRRRHTRCGRDWSSDVCSSDLAPRRHRSFPGGRTSRKIPARA